MGEMYSHLIIAFYSIKMQLGTIHILRNQLDWVGGVGQMIMFYAKKVWFTNEL